MANETNSKIKLKPVHFNLDNPNDLKLYNKANAIPNFTQWVKDKLSEKQPEAFNKDNIKDIVKEIMNETKNDIQSEKKDVKPTFNKKERAESKPVQQGNEELDSMMM